jgi:hypothetical protein
MARMGNHRLPDFIIAGAPRSATTWLHALASLHSEIALPQPAIPEPKFFLRDDLYSRGLDYYAQTWFDPLPADRVLGEKSANYLESADVAERIYHDLPDVKLVFMLRNPIDRAYSNYLWSKQNGVPSEVTFELALEVEAERERNYPDELRFARPHSFFSRGLYADYLERFYRLFPHPQILTLRTEDIEAQPRELARSFYSFLGVEARAELVDALGLVNAVEDRESQLDPATRTKLQERYREPNRRLTALLGPSFRLWDEI